jgi:hypothetical protein
MGAPLCIVTLMLFLALMEYIANLRIWTVQYGVL